MSASPCRKDRMFCRELASDPMAVDAFCCEMRTFLTEKGLCSEIFPVEMLLRESLNNALIHGNCCVLEKKIQVQVRIGLKWVVMRVKDEGNGFNFREAEKKAPACEATCGRGLIIYSLYANRVHFNAKGNQVVLWRSLRGKEKP